MAKKKATKPDRARPASSPKVGLLDKMTTLIVVLFFCSVVIAHLGGQH